MLLCAWIVYCSKIIYCDMCYETISGIMIGTSQYIIIIHETDNLASGKFLFYLAIHQYTISLCWCVFVYVFI